MGEHHLTNDFTISNTFWFCLGSFIVKRKLFFNMSDFLSHL